MAALTEEQASAYMTKLLTGMSRAGGSDLFIANDFPPSMKANGSMMPLATRFQFLKCRAFGSTSSCSSNTLAW
jgi:Tfp pilus assembly ATPase PilU